MIEREVFQARQLPDGTVTALVHRGEEWSPRSVEDVIADIASGRVSYVVPWHGRVEEIHVTDDGARIDVADVEGASGGLSELPYG